MNIRYRIDLTVEERNELTKLLSAGKHSSRKLKRAQILLAADGGAGDEEIARNPWGWRVDGLSDQATVCGGQS